MLTATVNKSVFSVGETPVYTITGGPPNGTICWSSVLNGVPTAEQGTCYGQHLNELGEWQAAGNSWTQGHIGNWEKVVSVYPPGSYDAQTAAIDFTVRAATAPAPSPVPSPIGAGTTPAASGSVGSFLSGSFTIGGIQIPKIAAIGGAVLLALALGGGGGRR